MLETRCILGILSVGVMACGGGSSPPTGTPDAGRSDPAPGPGNGGTGGTGGGNVVCAQPQTINTATPLDFSKGQAQGTAPAGGALEVDVLVTTNTAGTAGLVMVQLNNAGLFGAAAGKAGRFEKPPALGTYPLDADDSFGFGLDFVDGVTTDASGKVTIKPTQVQVLDPTAGGMVKLDAWSPAAKPGGTTTISATITNAKFKGFNVMADGSLSQTGNGCDITIQKLQFTGMSVKWQTAAFPAVTAAAAVAPRVHGARTLEGAAVFHLDPQE